MQNRCGRAAENNVSAWHRKWRGPDGREEYDQSQLKTVVSLYGPGCHVCCHTCHVMSISDRNTDIDRSTLPVYPGINTMYLHQHQKLETMEHEE